MTYYMSRALLLSDLDWKSQNCYLMLSSESSEAQGVRLCQNHLESWSPGLCFITTMVAVSSHLCV